MQVDHEVADSKLRLAGFAAINQYLIASNNLRRALDLDSEDLLIVLTVALGSVQRLLRQPDPEGLALSASVLEPEEVVPVSRRSVARATDLPRETVRRRAASLIERGVLAEWNGGLRSARRLVLEPAVQGTVHDLLVGIAGTSRLLIREGILKV